MYSAPSACTCLCLHFLLLCFQVQVLVAEENVDFRIHVENQTRARDDVSRKQLRLYQLYSRTSGKHIQVLGRRISARGEDGDKYAQLLVETDTFGSQVRIKGKETEFYLCMNRKGKLVGKPDGTSKETAQVRKQGTQVKGKKAYWAMSGVAGGSVGESLSERIWGAGSGSDIFQEHRKQPHCTNYSEGKHAAITAKLHGDRTGWRAWALSLWLRFQPGWGGRGLLAPFPLGL
uniref:Fibroblast growth factor 18 n=1 Tax=Oryctolagus cuniculus TaxID=9986 RepID=A0A5F9CJM6_RABIT